MAALAEQGTGADLLDLGQDLAQDIADRIVATLEDNAPAITKDGGFIRAGVSAELDELRAVSSGGRDQIPGHRGARARAHRNRLAQGQVQ